MQRITGWVLAHKRIVVAFWIALTLVGMASAGSASKALKQKFSVPGKEGWQTNQQIARDFRGTGGNSAPLVPVVTLPAGKTVSSPGVRTDLGRLEARLEHALPGTRLAVVTTTTTLSDEERQKKRETAVVLAAACTKCHLLKAGALAPVPLGLANTPVSCRPFPAGSRASRRREIPLARRRSWP